MNARFRCPVDLLFACLIVPIATAPARAADWPMWRFDAARTAASPEALASNLHPQWTLRLPPPRTAWPENQTKLQFDALYEPIVVGDVMVVPSMLNDSVTAYDTKTGARRWRFFSDGPVRFAPIGRRDKIWFASDDGFLYCLSASDGTLIWRFRGGPDDRRVLGNDRLISTWPVRGAPVLYDDTIYFAAGIWPFMGIFVYALDADTGRVVWTNSGHGTDYIVQQHNSPAFAGVAPQGYLATTDEHLLIPGGRSMPAVYDRRTGDFLHFDLASRAMGSKGGGGYAVMACEAFYVNSGDAYDLADGKYFSKASAGVLTRSAMYGVDDSGGLVAWAPSIDQVSATDRRGRTETRKGIKTLWKADFEPSLYQIFVAAGERLYGTLVDGRIVGIDVDSSAGKAAVSWSADVDERVSNMIVANGRLFAVTAQQIHAFGSDVVDKVAVIDEASRPSRIASNEARAEARSLLDRASTRHGYALVLGVGDGNLVESLLGESDTRIVVVDPDTEKVDALRRRFDQTGEYGSRVAVHVGDPRSFSLPPYWANLVASADLDVAGVEDGASFVEQVFEPLRPYGGVACFRLTDEQHDAFARAVERANVEGAQIGRDGVYTILSRPGALPGAGSWTHQYGDAANSVFSPDQRVRAPLGLLWFGGPSNEDVLPRHGHGPAPQVVGGRLFIEGPDMMRAVDVYTGRLLWQRSLPGVGEFYNYTSHEPGANVVGSNYVSLADGVYVVYRDACLRLDPATGETLSTFDLPSASDDGSASQWGHLSAWEDLLIAGARPFAFEDRAFTYRDFRRLRGEALTASVEMVHSWRGFEPIGDAESVDGREFVVTNLNKLLADPKLLDRIPPDVRELADSGALERQFAERIANGDADRNPQALEALSRQLLETYYDLPRYRKPGTGQYGSLDRTASARLVALNRQDGEALWSFSANHAFRHNAIAVGGGRVFAIDRQPDAQASYLRRRGLPSNPDARLVALDVRTGRLLWEVRENIFGTWLSYSVEHDVLLQAGSRFGDRALDEVGRGMVAYDGTNGSVLWQNDLTYGGPCMLYHDWVITQGYREPAFALDIRTGGRVMRAHPLTGEQTAWGYTRNYGCNTAIAAEHLLTFRSAAAGYYDMLRDGGTGNLGGFRSGCTSNLIVADGVFNAPDYTRTCTCSYSNQTSIALVPMADVDVWTFSPHRYEGDRVRRIGINFGAPGDRLADDGTLWLDYPSVGGPSPDVPVTVEPDSADFSRQHTSTVDAGELAWVAVSGVRGARSIRIQLAESSAESRLYSVRLIFSVPETEDGHNVFSVAIQGETVLRDFDIAAEAGGRNRTVLKPFDAVSIADELRIDLQAGTGTTWISGVQIVAQ